MAKKEGRGGDSRGSHHQYRRGLWTVEEDKILMDYVAAHGKGRWNVIAKRTGLRRCGKSCRLRWMNYLQPDVKRDGFTKEEEDLIVRLHKLLGNRWSLIAKRIPGRTDNQVKNYWNTHLSKKLGIGKRDAGMVNPARVSEVSKASSSANSTNACADDTHKSTEKTKVAADAEGSQSHSDNTEIQAEVHPAMAGDNSGMSSLWDFDGMSMTTLLFHHEYPNNDLSWLRT